MPPPKELQRLQTDATSSIDFFAPELSARESKKLMAYVRYVVGGGTLVVRAVSGGRLGCSCREWWWE
jgi:hypothetical protein